MKYIVLINLLFLATFSASALEIDEKLTLRILKLSKTKKTMLINRGLEDGLVVGDHAKFFLTDGVIARGVVVKAAPTRTIWSVYRIIDGTDLVEEKVMNLKVSTPLKLTEDSSKSFRANVYANQNASVTIPLARGADDLGSQLTEQERKDLESLGGNPPAPVYTQYNMGIDVNRTLEVFGVLHLNSLSTSNQEGSTSSSSGSNTVIDFSLGLEKYFTQKNSPLGKTSLFLLLHSVTKEVTDIRGIKASINVLEAGGGLNYHYLAHPLSYGRLIGYVGGSVGIGSTTDTLSASSTNTTLSSSPDPISGSSTFLSVGTGFKYYLSKGFGARAFLDYYSRSETYVFSDDDDSTKTVSGPRIQLGLSYRW